MIEIKRFVLTVNNRIVDTKNTNKYINSSYNFLMSYKSPAIYSSETLKDIIIYCENNNIPIYGNIDGVVIKLDESVNVREVKNLYLFRGKDLVMVYEIKEDTFDEY